MLKITNVSHTDHGLTESQLEEIVAKFSQKGGFFIETFILEGAQVDCGLHGPLMGDEEIPEGEVGYEIRGDREGPSRLTGRSPRKTEVITVIAGPVGEDPCVMYTCYGGPCAPREPWNCPEGADRWEAVKFWRKHALSV